MKIINL